LSEVPLCRAFSRSGAAPARRYKSSEETVTGEGTTTHNISGRQKENRGGCTCTLGEVQSGEEEIGGLSSLRNLLRATCQREISIPSNSKRA
jgi:hypothetical protein